MRLVDAGQHESGTWRRRAPDGVEQRALLFVSAYQCQCGEQPFWPESDHAMDEDVDEDEGRRAYPQILFPDEVVIGEPAEGEPATSGCAVSSST